MTNDEKPGARTATRAPARSRPDTDRVMRLGSTQVGDRERDAIEEVLRDQVFYRYHGSKVAAFERRFAAELLDGRRTLALNSGSSALEVAFAALDEEPGFEVLVPALGFVSCATAVIAAGGVPRFVPVDRSLGIDMSSASAYVTDRTRAVLAVHMYGAACDLAAVCDFAQARGLHVVEDAAQACGASFAGQPVGTYGAVATFSFQHFKLLSTGEGGMVASADPDLMDRAQCLHDAASYWVARDLAERVGRLRAAPANLRMSELEGALGLAQLERIPQWVGSLRAAKRRLHDYLADVPDISLRPLPDPEGEVGSTLIFYCPDADAAAETVEGLRAEGVNAGPLLGPPGSNRHFAGDWDWVMRQCGAAPAPQALISQVRRLLGSGICLSLDLRYDERDVTETLKALQRVVPC